MTVTSSGGKVDLGGLRIRLIQHDRPSDRLNDLGLRKRVGERRSGVPRRDRREIQHLDLDQLTRRERIGNSRDRGFRNPAFPDVENRLQPVGLAAEEGTLLRCQGLDVSLRMGFRTRARAKLAHSGFSCSEPGVRTRRTPGRVVDELRATTDCPQPTTGDDLPGSGRRSSAHEYRRMEASMQVAT